MMRSAVTNLRNRSYLLFHALMKTLVHELRDEHLIVNRLSSLVLKGIPVIFGGHVWTVGSRWLLQSSIILLLSGLLFKRKRQNIALSRRTKSFNLMAEQHRRQIFQILAKVLYIILSNNGFDLGRAQFGNFLVSFMRILRLIHDEEDLVLALIIMLVKYPSRQINVILLQICFKHVKGAKNDTCSLHNKLFSLIVNFDDVIDIFALEPFLVVGPQPLRHRNILVSLRFLLRKNLFVLFPGWRKFFIDRALSYGNLCYFSGWLMRLPNNRFIFGIALGMRSYNILLLFVQGLPHLLYNLIHLHALWSLGNFFFGSLYLWNKFLSLMLLNRITILLQLFFLLFQLIFHVLLVFYVFRFLVFQDLGFDLVGGLFCCSEFHVLLQFFNFLFLN